MWSGTVLNKSLVMAVGLAFLISASPAFAANGVQAGMSSASDSMIAQAGKAEKKKKSRGEKKPVEEKKPEAAEPEMPKTEEAPKPAM